MSINNTTTTVIGQLSDDLANIKLSTADYLDGLKQARPDWESGLLHSSNEGLYALLAKPSVPTRVRHLPPGSLDPEALKDRLSDAHARHRDQCRGGCRLERRP